MFYGLELSDYINFRHNRDVLFTISYDVDAGFLYIVVIGILVLKIYNRYHKPWIILSIMFQRGL